MIDIRSAGGCDVENPVVVWGNCQARPLADLLTEPLRDLGWSIVEVPPVFEIAPAQLDAVRTALTRAAALVSQPVSDSYAVPGCGTSQLAALLPPSGRLITVPVLYDVSAFPFLVSGHDGHGDRVDAPVTDYHDLRILAAAARGRSARELLDEPADVPAEVYRAISRESRTELRRRDASLDVRTPHHLGGPEDMWTINHPGNPLLEAVARDVAALLGSSTAISAPTREYLGQRRAPLSAAVAEALGWPGTSAREEWIVDGDRVPWEIVVETQLDWYAQHPDVVTSTLRRNQVRARQLGLLDRAAP